MTTWLYFF